LHIRVQVDFFVLVFAVHLVYRRCNCSELDLKLLQWHLLSLSN